MPPYKELVIFPTPSIRSIRSMRNRQGNAWRVPAPNGLPGVYMVNTRTSSPLQLLSGAYTRHATHLAGFVIKITVILSFLRRLPAVKVGL